MSDEYVSRILLEVNGEAIDDFKSVEVEEVEVAKEVNLVNKTGIVSVTPRHKVTVDYVIPLGGAEFAFEEVKDGTLTIDRQDGTREQYRGVSLLKLGAVSYDGDKEAVRKITLLAAKGKE